MNGVMGCTARAKSNIYDCLVEYVAHGQCKATCGYLPSRTTSCHSLYVPAERPAVEPSSVHFTLLEVATPTRRAFSGHGGHALTWRSHGHSVAA